MRKGHGRECPVDVGQGDMREAESADQSLNKRAADIALHLARGWQLKGRLDRAIAGYEEAVRLQPDLVTAHIELGNLFLESGRRDEAVATYRRALALNPGEASLQRSLGDILAGEGETHGSGGSEVLGSPGRNEARTHQVGRIAVYTDRPGIYGAEQCNHLLMCGLVASGYRVICVQSKASHPLIQERCRLGIEHLWIEDDNIYDLRQTPRAFVDGSEARRVIETVNPELVIFSGGCPVSDLAARREVMRSGIPFVVVVHCVAPDLARLHAAYLPALPEIFKRAQAVIAVSNENLNLLRSLFGLPPDRGQVIYNGRPAEYFRPPDPSVRDRIRRELGIPADAVVCLTVARTDWVKGYQYQLKAMEHLKETAGWSRLHFLWVGGGTMQYLLRTQAARADVRDHITFLRDRSDVPDLLDAADMFVLPSEFEGMPLSILEAMAKGLPVIATAVSGIPEALGDTGRLLADTRFDPDRTARELATAIDRMGGDPGLRRVTGRAGKTRAEDMFRADRMLGEYLEVVRRILAAPSH